MLKCFLFALSLLSQIVDELCFAVYVFPISTRLELIIIIALAAATSIHYAVLESGLKWNGKGGLGHEKLSSRFGKVCSCSLTPKLRQLSRVVNVARRFPGPCLLYSEHHRPAHHTPHHHEPPIGPTSNCSSIPWLIVKRQRPLPPPQKLHTHTHRKQKSS